MGNREELTQHVEEIIETEQRCGHCSLYREPGDDITSRYMAVLDTIRLIMENKEQGLKRLAELSAENRVSPEALALMLVYYQLEISAAKQWIEEFYEKTDYNSALIFDGCLARKLEMTTLDRLSDLERREHIRQQVRTLQNKDKEPPRLFNGRGVVYTVITGGYDKIWEPLHVNPAWDYYCISDGKEIESKTWKWLPYKGDEELDPIRKNRKAKMLPWEFLKDYDYSIYIDGNIQIIGDLGEYVNWYAGDRSMLCFPHGTSARLTDELELIRDQRPKFYEAAKQQVEGYLSEGYPDNYPMVVASVLLRNHHDPILRKTMECWWDELRSKSTRDQISLGYVCWKNGYMYDLCELNIYENFYLIVKKHG